MPSLFDRRKGFRPQKKKHVTAPKDAELNQEHSSHQGWHILRLNHDGRGVSKNHNGKTVFVANGLPKESVRIRIDHRHPRFDEATAVEILEASPHRVAPVCAHYQDCGGCQLQHLAYPQQVDYKQAVLTEHLQKYAELKDVPLAPAIDAGEHQVGYRRRARLSIPAPGHQPPFLGFRGKSSQAVVQIDSCPVMHPRLNQHIKPLQTLIKSFPKRHQLGHLELLLNQQGCEPQEQTTTVIMRSLASFTSEETNKIKAFAEAHQCDVIADYGDRIEVIHAHTSSPLLLGYLLEQGLLRFGVNEFIQVNPFVNQRMVNQALEWLDLQGQERVLELFAGFGNFSIPLAQQAKAVVAVEVAEAHLKQGQENANENQCDNLQFIHADLSQPFQSFPFGQQKIDVLVLDPPRAGAAEVVADLSAIEPEKILYVSCNPATLSRDSARIIEQGYQLEKVCVMDMFAHTSHTEAMALFKRHP